MSPTRTFLALSFLLVAFDARAASISYVGTTLTVDLDPGAVGRIERNGAFTIFDAGGGNTFATNTAAITLGFLSGQRPQGLVPSNATIRVTGGDGARLVVAAAEVPGAWFINELPTTFAFSATFTGGVTLNATMSIAGAVNLVAGNTVTIVGDIDSSNGAHPLNLHTAGPLILGGSIGEPNALGALSLRACCASHINEAAGVIRTHGDIDLSQVSELGAGSSLLIQSHGGDITLGDIVSNDPAQPTALIVDARGPDGGAGDVTSGSLGADGHLATVQIFAEQLAITGAFTTQYYVHLHADDIDFAGASAFARTTPTPPSAFLVDTLDPQASIGLGTGASGDLVVPDEVFPLIADFILTVGTAATTGTITTRADLDTGTATVLRTAGDIDLSAGPLTAARYLQIECGGALDFAALHAPTIALRATGTITGDGPLVATDVMLDATADVTLTHPDNNFSALGLHLGGAGTITQSISPRMALVGLSFPGDQTPASGAVFADGEVRLGTDGVAVALAVETDVALGDGRLILYGQGVEITQPITAQGGDIIVHARCDASPAGVQTRAALATSGNGQIVLDADCLADLGAPVTVADQATLQLVADAITTDDTFAVDGTGTLIIEPYHRGYDLIVHTLSVGDALTLAPSLLTVAASSLAEIRLRANTLDLDVASLQVRALDPVAAPLILQSDDIQLAADVVTPHLTLDGPTTITAALSLGDVEDPAIVDVTAALHLMDDLIAHGALDLSAAVVHFDVDDDPHTITVNGTLDVRSATLAVTFDQGFDAGTVVTLVHNDGDDPITGTFASLPEGSVIEPLAGWLVTYLADGNDLAVRIPPAHVTTPDSVTLAEDTTMRLTPLDNDAGEALTLGLVGEPEHGAVTVDGAAITYAPEPNFYGADTFSYESCAANVCVAVPVTVTVTAVNDAPTAVPDVVTTEVDVAVSVVVLANDSDVDGDAITLGAVTSPDSGSVTISGDALVFTPTAGFVGTTSFVYAISDGRLEATTNVTITITEPAPEPEPTPESGAEVETMRRGSDDGCAGGASAAWLALVALGVVLRRRA